MVAIRGSADNVMGFNRRAALATKVRAGPPVLRLALFRRVAESGTALLVLAYVQGPDDRINRRAREPAVEAPSEGTGYGGKPLCRSITGQFGGTIESDWITDGVLVKMSINAGRLSVWPSANGSKHGAAGRCRSVPTPPVVIKSLLWEVPNLLSTDRNGLKAVVGAISQPWQLPHLTAALYAECESGSIQPRWRDARVHLVPVEPRATGQG